MYPAKDLTGLRFGRLVVLGEATTQWDTAGRPRRQLRCICDCGRTLTIYRDSVKNGLTKSCGCLRSDNAKTRALPPGVSASKRLYRMYAYQAAKRGHAFDLSFPEFLDLTARDCTYCGAPPAQQTNVRNGNGRYTYNGIDRVNNALGYVPGNCVPACGDCNIAKGTLSYDQFVTLCTRVSNYQKGRKTNG